MPPFLSLRFHLQYFPALIWRRIGPRAEPRGSAFANHGSVEFVLLFAVAVLAVAIGLPAALQRSAIGIVAAALGVVGIATLLVFSVAAARGTYAGFDGFRVWVFFLFPMSAMTAGAFVGSLAHSHVRLLLYAAVGLVAGYPLGIGAGLLAQRLGWIAGVLDYLAMLELFGVLVVDIVLMYM